MSTTLVLSIPALREQDVEAMPQLKRLFARGEMTKIEHGFPAVTWPSQANVLTGQPPSAHGVVANGFYWRNTGEVEMWIAGNEVIESPQVWDVIKQKEPKKTTAAWFPMLSKRCGADHVCMPAPIHRPDGTEALWCFTKPEALYGELMEQFGHFPLHRFWGPLANIESSQWIVQSALATHSKFQPDFWYIYLPHLDYAPQKAGPDSQAAATALKELDEQIGKLAEGMLEQSEQVDLLAISEYVIGPVERVAYPNRVLRDAGLLSLSEDEDGKEVLDIAESEAWTMVDHQCGHVFVRNRDPSTIRRVAELFEQRSEFQSVLYGDQRQRLDIEHPRSGDVVLVSAPDSWQAYYWWEDERKAPDFARSVDIHRKPGYDPVELHVDEATRSIPLDATLIRGSHGVPGKRPEHQGVALCSRPGLLKQPSVRDLDLFHVMLNLALDAT